MLHLMKVAVLVELERLHKISPKILRSVKNKRIYLYGICAQSDLISNLHKVK